MTTEHIKTRRKIKDIATIKDFNELIDRSTLSEDDKALMRMHYLQGKDFRYIGDTLGFSESTIKYRHRKALKKISKLF